MKPKWIVAVTLSLVGALARDAAACSQDLDYIEGCAAARRGETRVPANTIFEGSTCPDGGATCVPDWRGTDRPAVWEAADVPLPGAVRYYRLAEPRPTSLVADWTHRYPYYAEMLLDAPKTTLPARPTIETLEVLLTKDPSSGGGFGCSDVDTVQMHITAPDAGPAFVVFYFGATSDEALNVAAPEKYVGACAVGRGYDVSATAGESEGRARANQGGFSRSGRYCVSAAVVDLAGNVGPRSEPQCFATDDEHDPHVHFVDSENHFLCFCRSGPGSVHAGGAGALGLFAVAGVVLARRRRSRS